MLLSVRVDQVGVLAVGLVRTVYWEPPAIADLDKRYSLVMAALLPLESMSAFVTNGNSTEPEPYTRISISVAGESKARYHTEARGSLSKSAR